MLKLRPGVWQASNGDGEMTAVEMQQCGSWFGIRGTWGLALFVLLLPGRPVALGAASAEDRIGRYVAAGEYGPALEAARGLSDSAARDHWLGRIAQAQAQSGARQAARHTLADIRAGRSLSETLDAVQRRPVRAAGGAALADFDTLIDLITSTIAPTSWEDTGGAGVIQPFPTGVYVDATGLLKPLPESPDPDWLAATRREVIRDGGNRNPRVHSPLRKVSLVRLERELQVRRALGLPPDNAMSVLAGLHRLRFLFVFPETGDLVLAGPAGDWETDARGRVVNVDTRAPVWRLEDFVTVWRNAEQQNGQFGCAIRPSREGLAATKACVEAWQARPLRPGQRDQWLAEVRAALGKQRVEVWGIDARTNVARVLVEADYHMKLIGMGLEDGTLGVSSYLEAVRQAAPDSPPEMTVLRWWFTLNYEGIYATPQGDAFQFRGAGVKVLSENELLTATGERIHTGESEWLNRQFARSFTQHFDALAAKYPVYAELRNVFDMAIVAGLMCSHDLPGRLEWPMSHFRDPQACPVPLGPLPQEVDSVINVIELSRKTLLAGVSGGVAVDTRPLVRPDAVRVNQYGLMEAARGTAADQFDEAPQDAWWWD